MAHVIATIGITALMGYGEIHVSDAVVTMASHPKPVYTCASSYQGPFAMSTLSADRSKQVLNGHDSPPKRDVAAMTPA